MKLLGIALGAVWLAAATPALAAGFAPKPNMTFDLEPVAPEGSFSSWTVTDLKGLNALRTRAAFSWFGRDPKWAPGFKIALRAGSEEVMLSIGGRAARPMDIALESYRGQKELGAQGMKLAPDSSDEIELELYWTSAGEVTACAATEGGRDRECKTATMQRAPEDLAVYVSTASVRLTPLQLGTGSP